MRIARRKRQPRRSGATLVEFAICSSVLFLVIFASVELTRVNMIRHTLDNATYEAARRGIVPGATVADVQTAATEVLNVVGASGATITVTPSTITDETQDVNVSVSLPLDGVGWITPMFFGGKTLTSELTLSRELFVADAAS